MRSHYTITVYCFSPGRRRPIGLDASKYLGFLKLIFVSLTTTLCTLIVSSTCDETAFNSSTAMFCFTCLCIRYIVTLLVLQGKFYYAPLLARHFFALDQRGGK